MTLPLGPVVYSIWINDQLVTDTPLDVELRQGWGMHDMFFLRIEYYRQYLLTHRLPLWPDNAPIRIVWGMRPSNIQTWYGYVNHHTVDANADSGSQAMQITYVCLGTSKPMNTDKSRQWGAVTPTYIAKKIAGEYGFRCVLTSTNWVLSYEVQANESDFCFLNRIADKVGYRFWVSGGTLYFIDPSVVLQSSSVQAIPSFKMDKLFTKLDTVRQFHMNEGGNLPGAAIAYRSIFGLDKNSGSVFQVTANTNNSPTISQYKSDRPVDNLSEAQYLVAAWEGMNQWWQSATAELYGSTIIYPGKVVYLSGNQMPPNTEGYWIVGAVTHVLKSSWSTSFQSDRFFSRVELMKNTTGISPILKNVTSLSPEFIDCKLQQNQTWIATQATVIYDGVQA